MNQKIPTPRLDGFLADHSSPAHVVEIRIEPPVVYTEEVRGSSRLNFDFLLTGLTDRTLALVFLKVAVYDADGNLIGYRYLNRNAVGPSGIETIGPTRIASGEVLDLFNPFHTFPAEVPLHRLRYMFTFRDVESSEEFYMGDVSVFPQMYQQAVELELPVEGLLTVMDGCDYFSHHRRFAVSLVRSATNGAMQNNFARFALDFVLIGEDGNTRRMTDGERTENYDFHFVDARRFYSDGSQVSAPGSGEVVVAQDGREDLYEGVFDFEAAVAEGQVDKLAGNYVVIKHNVAEYSHLFHFRRGSLQVEVGQHVDAGQPLGRIGFSGAATTYSHLHYQLMDGPDFLVAHSLPIRFRQITMLTGGRQTVLRDLALDTGDLVWSDPDRYLSRDSRNS